jgi:nitronate monooxygenase
MLLPAPLPIVAAPMAGGPSTPALAHAARAAGAFAFVAAGYLSVSVLDDLIRDAGAGQPIGVNLFVPGSRPSGADRAARDGAIARYAAAIAGDARDLGVELGAPVWDDDGFDDKLDLVVEAAPAAVSFTFGLPSAEAVRRLRAVGSIVLASVTSPAEARAAAETGVDGLWVQGPRAGGHSATFTRDGVVSDVPTGSVVAAVRAVTTLPIIGAGGVGTAADVLEIIHAGAEAVAVGTALLRTDEAGTNPVHRAALAAPEFTETVMTRAYTGRSARALRSRFTDAHPDAPDAYPEVHHLTRPLRQAAVRSGDANRVHLWAGTGFRSARAVPAASVIDDLCSEL